MANENKKPTKKAPLITLIICILAVLSGKPISEVISDISSAQMQEPVAVEETVEYDYEESVEESVEAVIEEEFDGVELADDTDVNEETSNDDLSADELLESIEDEDISFSEPEVEISDHRFRSKKLLDDHFQKHGKEMGFASEEEYVEAANRVISSPDALYKLEKEDNDHIYYLEETNEFVVVSQDGYIRTYFNPSAGIKYFNRQ
ncbi:MAG: hypothetical protein IKY23_02825 [Lachnospiraceae bacterium]|nr:hypothetical protein [Lachnospiraceae bacterium]